MHKRNLSPKCYFVFSDFTRSREYQEVLSYLHSQQIALRILYFPPTKDAEFLEFLRQSKFDFAFFHGSSVFGRWKFIIREMSLNLGDRLFIVGSLSSLVCLPVILFRKLKFVWIRHHGDLHHSKELFKWKMFDKLVARFAETVVAVSETHRKLICDEEGVDGAKVLVCHGGFDAAKFLAKRSIGNAVKKDDFECGLTFGVMCRLVEWKGVKYIVEAFQKFLELGHNGRLLIRGDGPAKESIERSIRIEFQEKITFLSDVESPIYFYEKVDVFIHAPTTKFSESFGMVYLESLAIGVPSIFTKSGIASELPWISDYSLVVDYKNSLDIQKAMIWISKEENYRSFQRPTAEYFRDFTFEALSKRYQRLINM